MRMINSCTINVPFCTFFFHLNEHGRTETKNKIRDKTPKAKPLSCLHQDCWDGLSGLDFKRPQEEELRRILYPGELLKKVHIKGSLLYIWCFFYERSHFLAFPCQIFFLRLRNIHVVLRSAQQSAPRGRSASISIIGLFLRPTLHCQTSPFIAV